MIPNMFKIAGELTPTVFHIAARAVAGQALSIFGDHSDIMAVRSTGFALLSSNSIQEVQDFALISQAATLESRIPFLHFFDGFRTSHEIQKVDEIPYETMRTMITPESVRAHRQRGLNPEHPAIRGTSQNPDDFFAARESVSKYYQATPGIIKRVMDRFAELTGRSYHLFDYVGAPDAERVVVMMGSGAETMNETVNALVSNGEKVGLIKVRLFRPFDTEALLRALPKSTKAVAVLDRTKEPGALGDAPRNHFTVGIYDDRSYSSLEWDESFSTEGTGVHRALFYGLGSDGTVGANKNSIKIIDKKLKFYVIDAVSIADEMGMGGRINVIMQTAFFKISGVLPENEAISLIKEAIEKTYGKKGQEIVNRNIATVDAALDRIEKVDYSKKTSSEFHMADPVPKDAPDFIREVTGEIIAGRGNRIPVSKLRDDGTYPVGTTKYEKRNIAEMIPIWDPQVCIQCGDCSAVCPHGTIRMKAYDPELLENAPSSFKFADARGRELKGLKFTIQVAPEDCTGCSACVNICPAFRKENGEKTDFKAINMEAQSPVRDRERENWNFFQSLPNTDPSLINRRTTKGSQLLEPLFEFSGACAGCGETPYVKLMTQLFGDRAIIANATGCSSIYGRNLPTTPYTTRKDGRGPTWSNSLFEDAAEFSFGMRLTSDKLKQYAEELVDQFVDEDAEGVDTDLLRNVRENPQSTTEEIEQQRTYVRSLKDQLETSKNPLAGELLPVADHLVRRSVWILGGDGWAYDIGFGGLDHVIASGRNVNILVMDTEVYSNTGGQMSKATPIGAIAKFAASGKAIAKKDLGMMAMTYGYVYVARVAMGYNRQQTIKAMLEAESYDGPSIIIAYSHCIAHGIDMARGMDQWNLYKYLAARDPQAETGSGTGGASAAQVTQSAE